MMTTIKLNLNAALVRSGRIVGGTAELHRIVDGTTIRLLVPATIQDVDAGFTERWLAIPARRVVTHQQMSHQLVVRFVNADEVWQQPFEESESLYEISLRLVGVESDETRVGLARRVLDQYFQTHDNLIVVLYGLEESMWPMKQFIGDIYTGSVPLTRWLTSQFPELWRPVPQRYTPAIV